MNQDLALSVLDRVMGWDEEKARREFSWLELISRYKYDTYRDFVAGVRFTERLADWLQQFEQTDRTAAYEFVRNKIIYLTPAEINHLVETAYPDTMQRWLREAIAAERKQKTYLLWSDPVSIRAYDCLLRSTLFIGLSDGARIDTFRRANAGVISNEQVLLAPEISPNKWDQVLKDLRDHFKNSNAKFKMAFLIDDFIGTGTTLLRYDDGKWRGRLPRFWENLTSPNNLLKTHFESGWKVVVHHYVATEEALKAVEDRNVAAKGQKGDGEWFPSIDFSCGTLLKNEIRITETNTPQFFSLMNRYYNESIQNEHTKKGGKDSIRLGYGDCSLPLILEHNTPNNSVALLWADCDGSNGQHEMRPLFRRRERHS